MEEIMLSLLSNYGLAIFGLSLSGIFILGILKFFGTFNKIPKEKRKYWYAGISALLSLTAIAIYLLATSNFTIEAIGVLTPTVYMATVAAYGIYENSGLRGLFRLLGNLILRVVLAKRDALPKVEKKADVEKNAEPSVPLIT
jgi:membrane-associated HD superfamily phosphohydrolase